MSEPAFIRPGEEVDLTNCDREPIHVPGAIQPHGVLLGVDERGAVRFASANAAAGAGTEVLGRRLDTLLDWPGLAAVEVTSRPSYCGLAGFGGQRFEVVAHRTGQATIVELEPADDVRPDRPVAHLQELEAAFAAVRAAEDLPALYAAVVRACRSLTGHDRVMLYRFDADWHGVVAAEDRREDLEAFLGLHYPATDIPVQARRLYVQNVLRVIADVDYLPVPLVPADDPDARVDMSQCTLRSVSPIHLEYLRNMGVRATLVVSLLHRDDLWGMISCHHMAPRRVPALVRGACAALAEIASAQAQLLEHRVRSAREGSLRVARDRVVAVVREADDVLEGLAAAGDALLEMAGASGAVCCFDDRCVAVGRTPPEREVRSIVAALAAAQGSVAATHHLAGVNPGFAALAPVASGVMVADVGGGDWLAWFRGEQVEEVTWGGRPDPRAGETLTPRASFAAWRELVRGRARRWEPVEVESVHELGAAIPRLMLDRARRRLSELAVLDPLTGLPNRLLGERILDEALRSAPQPDVGVAFIDLDHFKRANDSLGHAGGDALLIAAGERLRATLRTHDVVARFGGDEFVAVLRDLRRPGEAAEVAQRIIEAFRRPVLVDGREVFVTVSAGVAVAAPGQTARDVLRDADWAMYRAKDEGRDQLFTHIPGIADDVPRRVQLASDIRLAVDRDELVLHYQPVCAPDGRVHGVEALLRWRHPVHGLLTPPSFLDLVEDTGLILRIGEWVLREGTDQQALWRRDGHDVVLAVNVAARQLDSAALATLVEQLLDASGTPPDRLVLEVTETSLMRRPGVALHALLRLRRMGVHVAIDDFGTGFSSLAQLRQLPADILKVDRGFVAGLTEDPLDASIVGTVVQLARAAGMRTVAEGVETPAQAEALIALGCDLLQGYLIGRPLPPSELDLGTRPVLPGDAGRRGPRGRRVPGRSARPAGGYPDLRSRTGAAKEHMARGKGLLAETVYRRMRTDLLRGRIRPGDRVPEVWAAARYRASRTPVREACRRLAEEGLLVHRPRHGYAAPVIDAREISELYDVRRSLEVLAVRGAAAADGARPELDRLRRAWRAGAPEPGEDAVFLDEAFHLGLARSSGNRVLATMLEGINARIRLVRVYDFLDAERVARTVEQHTRILEAVAARDADVAAALMDAHIAESQRVATTAAGQALAELWAGAATA